jgi:ribose/xylose/arabinose/galactoside ABC-type transport system permease subunit
MVVVLIALLAVATISYPGFVSSTNLSNIVSQNAPLGLVAIGMTFIIIAGGFDLSVGAIYALTATLFAGIAINYPIPVAAIVAISVGLAAGAINGFIVTRLHVNPFVATLGTSSIIAGLALVYSHGFPQIVKDPAFKVFGQGQVAGVPIASIVMVVAFVIGGIVLHRSVYGRNVFAVGGNWEASRLSGIRVDLVRASTYAITGILTALAGMMIASRLGVGQADIGTLLPLDAIAVVVVGGTSLLGGEGALWRTAVGLAVLATLTNLFYSLNVDLNWQLAIKGAIIVGAVALDAFVRRLR